MKHKYKSHGKVNFKYTSINLNLRGIYNYIRRPKIIKLKNIEQANDLIFDFCQEELHFSGSINQCAKLIQKNWNLFKNYISNTKKYYEQTN